MDNGQKYKQKIEKTVPLENVYAFERNILNVLGYSNIASLLISTVAFSAECYIKIILSLRLLNYILCGRINLHTHKASLKSKKLQKIGYTRFQKYSESATRFQKYSESPH